MNKICLVCNKEINKIIRLNQKYCSLKCKRNAKYLRHNESIKKKSLSYYYANKEQVLEYQKSRIERLRKNNPEFHRKYLARHLAAKKISLRNTKCEMCGKVIDLQRHHQDYSKPLEIIIVCRNCHNNTHKRYPRILKV